MDNIDFTNVENFDLEVLSDVNIVEVLGGYGPISLMASIDRKFINGIIRKTKPKKILELGVAAGSGTALILNAIKDIPNSKLYSIDYLEKWWMDTTKNIVWVVEEKFNNLANKWEIYRGGTAAKFMEQIGGDIDLCIIDTVHMNPCEFLDFLSIFPFLKKKAIVIIHDIQVHLTKGMYYNKTTCCNLFASLKGAKYIPSTTDDDYDKFPNIGMVVLDEDIKDHIFDIFFLLTMNWDYEILEKDHNYILKLFNKYYSNDLVKIYECFYLYNKTRIKLTNNFNEEIDNINNTTNNRINDINNEIMNINNTTNNRINDINNEIMNINNTSNNRINDIENKIMKLVNALAWWIPVKKWRDNFRNKYM